MFNRKPSIKNIVKKVRKVCYDYAMSDESSKYYYHKRKDLKGMCPLAAIVLREVLIYHGYNADVMVGRCECCCHCWVALDNGKEADITATQFRKPSVYITNNIDSPFYAGEIKNDYNFFFKEWCKDQRPTKSQIKNLVKISVN